MEITINQNDNQLIRIGNSNIQDINITEDENQEIEINNTTPQSLNVSQPETQTILIDGGGSVIGITDVLVNGVTVVSGNIAYITVPTKTSELINNSGFITSETDPTVPSYVKAISLADINNWNNKQNALVSGSNIKTINNESLLGSGNINITGTQYSAGDGISIENDIISNTITNYNDLTDLPTIPTKTSDLLNDNNYVSEDELSDVAFDGSYTSLSNTPEIPDSTSQLVNDSNFVSSNQLATVAFDGDYDSLINKPTIPNKTSDLTNDGNGTYPFMLNKASTNVDGIGLYGGSSAYARNLSYVWDSGAVQETKLVANYDDIPTNTSQLTNDSNFAVTDSNNYFTAQQTFQQGLYTPQDLYIDGKFYTNSEPIGYTLEKTFTMQQNISGGSWNLVTSEETLTLKKGYYIFIFYITVSGNSVYVTLNGAINQTRLENNYRISHNLESGYNMSGNIVLPYYLSTDSTLTFSVYGYSSGSYNGAWGKITAIKLN